MRSDAVLVGFLLAALSTPLAGSVTRAAGPPTDPAAEPSAAPAPAAVEEPMAAPSVRLSGPFGAVMGADPATPAAAAPDGTALDLWMRSAPLRLDVSATPDELIDLAVVSRPLTTGVPEEPLSDGDTSFAGPAMPGTSVVVATVHVEGHGSSEHAWLVHVPDREGSLDALLEIPGPVVLLESSSASVAGTPGDGCYVYLCSTAGHPPPPASLPELGIEVGETPSLRLDDGSAIVGWQGVMTMLGEAGRQRLEASGSFAAAPEAEPRLTGLEPSAAGGWLLELRVEYDRERGWQELSYRLVAE